MYTYMCVSLRSLGKHRSTHTWLAHEGSQTQPPIAYLDPTYPSEVQEGDPLSTLLFKALRPEQAENEGLRFSALGFTGLRVGGFGF